MWITVPAYTFFVGNLPEVNVRCFTAHLTGLENCSTLLVSFDKYFAIVLTMGTFALGIQHVLSSMFPNVSIASLENNACFLNWYTNSRYEVA